MSAAGRVKLLMVCMILSLGLLATALVASGVLASLGRFVMVDRWEEMIQQGVFSSAGLEKYQGGRFSADCLLLAEDLASEVLGTATQPVQWLIMAALVLQGVSLALAWRHLRASPRATGKVDRAETT